MTESCTPREIFKRPFDHHDKGFGPCHRDLKAVAWCSSKFGGSAHLDAPFGDMDDMMGDADPKFKFILITPAKIIPGICLASSLQRRRHEVLDATCQASPGLTRGPASFLVSL